MPQISIRLYQPKDRDAVRRICADTADKGEPLEHFFNDRQWLLILLTDYYTDFEPQSCLVAVDQENVVGYIMGSLDNRQYGLVMFWILIPKAIWRALWRGLFFQVEFRRLLKGMSRNWRRLFSWRKQSFHSHWAHIHIGVDRQYRGQKVGGRLVEAWMAYAKSKGVSHISASVHSLNQKACRFFESMGFKVQDSYPMVMLRSQTVEQYCSLLYVKKV